MTAWGYVATVRTGVVLVLDEVLDVVDAWEEVVEGTVVELEVDEELVVLATEVEVVALGLAVVTLEEVTWVELLS
jgi:hypothetical protein